MVLSHLPVTSFLQELEFTDKLNCHIPVCPFTLIICGFCSFDEHVTNTDIEKYQYKQHEGSFVDFGGWFVCLVDAFLLLFFCFILFHYNLLG